MIITRHGDSFFKLAYGDKTIALNPISKNSKQKTTKFSSDIAIASFFHPDFNGFEQVSYNGKTPFIIKGAGEYEILDVFIKGFALKQKFEGVDEMISSYTIFLDGINIAFLGPISSGEEFTNEAFEEFTRSDIFIVPIGGGETLSPKEAAKFVKQFLPKIVIPVMYNSKSDIEEFANELGAEIVEMDKLTIKTKDLTEDEKSKLILLKVI